MTGGNENRQFDLSETLERILSEPEFAVSASPGSDGRSEDEEKAVSVGAPSVSPEGIFSNPELMSKLPAIISMLSGGGKNQKQSEKCDPRINLLIALKPFLNRDRQEMIDNIVRFNKLSSMLGGLF